jgi:hypothetical protein
MKQMFLSIVLIIIFVGCVQHQQLTRDEWIANTTRVYENLDKETAIFAAEKVLKLADGNDFIIMHDEDGFYSSRNWTVYLVLSAAIGTDYWKFKTEQLPNGKLKVSINVTTQAGMITPMATTGGNYSVTSLPMAGTPVNGNSIYHLFWERFDFLIGKKNIWLSCKKSDELNKNNVTWGSNETLCNSFNIKNDTPDGVINEDIVKNKEL